MKVKSLLLAAAAFLAVGAQAQPTVSMEDLTVNKDNNTEVILLKLILDMTPNAELGVTGDFTNIQVNITFPEGMEPCMVDADAVYDDEYIPVDAEGIFCMEGEDIAQKQRRPVVSYTDNMDVTENWPTYDIVGANISKTPNTTNPNHFLTIFAKAREGYANGDRNFTAYVKYTQENDKSFPIGSPEEHVVLNTVHFEDGVGGGGSAVADVNAAKAVSSVKYYNAAGVASDSAFEGVNIVVTKYADGSQSVTKVVK